MNTEEHLGLLITSQEEFVRGFSLVRERVVSAVIELLSAPHGNEAGAARALGRELDETLTTAEYAAAEILVNLRQLAAAAAENEQRRAVLEEQAHPRAYLR
jgi:hypothetical protein